MSSQPAWWSRALRILGLVLMGLTAAFTIMGGAGTTCVALNPAGFGGKFAGIAPFQWLYILFVLVTLAIGILGVRAVVLLAKARRGSYEFALWVLGAGILVGVVHMAASRALRGSSMPVDMVVYTTVLTFLVLLIFRLPGVWQKLGLETAATDTARGRAATQIALAATGLLTLTVQFFMAPTHTLNGVNYADVWHTTMTILGLVQWLAAGCLFLRGRSRAARIHPALAAR